jgi:hypothetical protein
MSQKLTSSFLQDEVRLLVEHFGVERLRAALARVSDGAAESPSIEVLPRSIKVKRQPTASVTSLLEDYRQKDMQKYHVLTDFYTKLKYREILPESQDIIHFSQLVGLKDVNGKSRKDMIPRLMRFLIEQPTEQLQVNIKRAADISEQQRQQGFSVLTDKLLGQR